MTRPSDNRPSDQEIIDFLVAHHGIDPNDLEPADLEPLSGGFWSAAYGYRIDDEQLVLRINDEPDGFRDDRHAMRYSSDALPVPDVLAIKKGFGRWVAISRRHHGRFLEDFDPSFSDVLAPTVADLLRALRAVPDDGRTVPAWRKWLLDGIDDHPDHHTAGWRDKIATDRTTRQTSDAAVARIHSLIDACPDRRQLVHADLLHHNVLVTPAADAVTAVFSWKCSTWGDALYDLAWCTFWGRWHRGIGALDLWSYVVVDLDDDDTTDVSVRHHVYELQIGVNHLGWYATIDDPEGLAWTGRQLDELLERGPRRNPDGR